MIYLFAILPMLLAALMCESSYADWSPPAVKLASDLKHPYVAATPAELERVRAAYRSTGPGHHVVASIVTKAEAAMKTPVVYPPRGGQHNQWYQCDACQIALETVDDTHHRCPKCGKIYSGQPYDDVIFAKVHTANLRAMHNAAWAYAITGEKRFADFAASVLGGYARRYADYPYHDNASGGSKKPPGKSGGHLAEQTLNESMMVSQQIAPAYDLIYDTLSPDDRRHIEDHLIRPMLKNIAKHKAGKSNWQTWHNAAFITGGAVIGDAAWVERAINDPRNGFVYQMDVSVSSDGMWYENSWGYHFYTLRALAIIAEQARRLDIDLWHHPALKKMFTLPVAYTMPDGSLPRFGDDVNSSAMKQSHLMTLAAQMYRDEEIIALLPQNPTFESVLLDLSGPAGGRPTVRRSEVFEGAGHAILRTQGSADLAAAVTFGPFGGFHGHFDKLSFVFFGHGRELGVDPGRAASQAYRLPIHKDWYRATIGHNAVVVDGQSQEGVAGKLEAFAATPRYAAVLASCDEAYKGVNHRRLLLLADRYLLVVDELSADDDHRFDWIYHHRGTGVTSDAATRPGQIAEPYQGNEYLQNLRQGAPDTPVAVDFTDDAGGLRLLLDGQDGSELRLADGPGKSVTDRVPMAILTRHGRKVYFAAVLEPLAKGATAEVQSVELKPGDNGVDAVISRKGGTDRLRLSGNTIEVSAGDKVVLKTP